VGLVGGVSHDGTSPSTTQTGKRERAARGEAPSSDTSSTHLPFNPQYYQNVVDKLLALFYPRSCPSCNIQMTAAISTRPYVTRCRTCHRQASKLQGTPLENMRLPQWFFGWCIDESLKLHPAVLTARKIERSLGVSEKSACMLKRRVQLFCADLQPRITSIIRSKLDRHFRNFSMPPDGTNVTQIARHRQVVHADSMALFSASQRANKGRKNWKNRGLTASIYLQDRLGGRQIGTLAHVMGTRAGWCIIHSVPNIKAETIGPLIKVHIPRKTCIFTDEGYPWLYRVYRNHRMVNHSARSKDGRYRYARDRWCKNGVHNQVAEGLNSSLKAAMKAYRYFTPKYSQLYLSEWSTMKNIRYFGFAKIASAKMKGKSSCDTSPRTRELANIRSAVPVRGVGSGGDRWGGISTIKGEQTFHNRITREYYLQEEMSNKGGVDTSKCEVEEDSRLWEYLKMPENQQVNEAVLERDVFWVKGNSRPYQRKKERKYAALARDIWDHLPHGEFVTLSDVAAESAPKAALYRIVRRWAQLGLLDIQDLRYGGTGHIEHQYQICRLPPISLPPILYMITVSQYRKGEI